MLIFSLSAHVLAMIFAFGRHNKTATTDLELTPPNVHSSGLECTAEDRGWGMWLHDAGLRRCIRTIEIIYSRIHLAFHLQLKLCPGGCSQRTRILDDKSRWLL